MTVTQLSDRDRRPPNHRWGPRMLVNDGTVHGCEQSERTCLRCGLVRVTVHPPQGLPWREWRPEGGPQMQFTNTPPCVPGALEQ